MVIKNKVVSTLGTLNHCFQHSRSKYWIRTGYYDDQGSSYPETNELIKNPYYGLYFSFSFSVYTHSSACFLNQIVKIAFKGECHSIFCEVKAYW